MYFTLGGKVILQIGADFFYYEVGQTLFQVWVVQLLQNEASVIKNWGS